MASKIRTSKAKESLVSCNFMLHGKLRGVLFKTYTRKQARFLGLRGWCVHTENGGIKGHMEGPRTQLNQMKYWLQSNGSPRSVIERAEFTPTTHIGEFGFRTFSALKSFLYLSKENRKPVKGS